ncbi:hypothetical protein XENTR_v10023874 [Xenopus tropicalis]|nr:hypothetical protein XENTR_v10023874 [Xenopus tropicalis]
MEHSYARPCECNAIQAALNKGRTWSLIPAPLIFAHRELSQNVVLYCYIIRNMIIDDGRYYWLHLEALIRRNLCLEPENLFWMLRWNCIIGSKIKA